MRKVFVYILRCSDRSLYVGITQDLEARVMAHNRGRGAAFTFKRRPVQLVYSEPYNSEREAIQRESQLKNWSRAKKEALVLGDLEKLKQISKRR